MTSSRRNNGILTDAEINFAVNDFVGRKIPDYQMAALLMAIWFNGMNTREIIALTKAMARSGGMIDLSAIRGKKIDKHSSGGTVDKLESIPGYRTKLTRQEFFAVVNDCGLSLIGQSGNLAPADKKLYALRDVTATVDSIALIASSIMSKKLAAGNDCIWRGT